MYTRDKYLGCRDYDPWRNALHSPKPKSKAQRKQDELWDEYYQLTSEMRSACERKVISDEQFREFCRPFLRALHEQLQEVCGPVTNVRLVIK